MDALFFTDQLDFRRWLEENHDKETEVTVGFYRVGSGKCSMTWSEAVDQALCFGWIDGVRHKLDAESYSNRFTPRKAKSNWSAVNIKKVEELTKKGLMRPAGIKAYEKREESRSKIYIYENEERVLAAEYAAEFKANAGAWEFFGKQANWYRKLMIGWVMNAKQEATRISRLKKLIAASAKGERL